MRVLIFTLAVLVACSAEAQNLAVRYNGTNDLYCPTNWPAQVQPIGTNSVAAGFDTVMTQIQLNALKASLQAQYDAMQSTNAQHAAQLHSDANLARIVALFDQIPTARAQMQAIQNTNLTTVAACAVAIKAEANVLDGILEELQRLGPVLRDIYKPEQDTTP